MVESFENLDNILHDRAKDKYKKSIVEALNRYKKHSLAGKRKIKTSLLNIKFPPSLKLLSVQNTNRMASSLTAIASFPRVFFNSCNIQLLQGNFQAFPLTGLI